MQQEKPLLRRSHGEVGVEKGKRKRKPCGIPPSSPLPEDALQEKSEVAVHQVGEIDIL